MPKYDRPVYLIGGGAAAAGKGRTRCWRWFSRGSGSNCRWSPIPEPPAGMIRTFSGGSPVLSKEAGAAKVNHAIIAPDDADLKKAMKILDSADIVFVSGGDVEAGMEILQQKKMLDFFNGLYKQGKPFFGISRGHHAGLQMGALAGPG